MTCLRLIIKYYRSFRSYGRKTEKNKGFTLIETLIGLAIFTIFFGAIVIILQNILDNIARTRVRTTALEMAQEQMELIKNMPYNDVGTIGGIPQGSIEQTVLHQINGIDFIKETSITYIDDPYDLTAPDDETNTDYKKIAVKVSWEGIYKSNNPIVLFTNIAPKGLEDQSEGGTLFIQVFNAQGTPVENAQVTVDNTDAVPEIHLETLTDADGIVELPGSPSCVSCYQITVTKDGFSQDKTYSTLEVANPIRPHITAIDGEISQATFAIDQLSRIILSSYNTLYQPLSNVSFILRGSKIIGYDTLDNPVYKYENSTNTGGFTIGLTGLEWDSYYLDMSNSTHNFTGSNPDFPISLLPDTSVDVSIVAATKTSASLLIKVNNPAGELLSSASARLVNESLSYDETKVTAATNSANLGYAYFGSLNAEVYDLSINLPGYEEATGSYDIQTNQSDNIILNYEI